MLHSRPRCPVPILGRHKRDRAQSRSPCGRHGRAAVGRAISSLGTLFFAHDATRTPPTPLPRYSHEVLMRNDEIGTRSGLTHFDPQFRKNIHQLQAANAAVARHVASVEPPTTTTNARVNSISSSTPAAISPNGDVSGLSLNPGSGSPAAPSLFSDGGLGGQAAQLTCKCLSVWPPLSLLFRPFAGGAGASSVYPRGRRAPNQDFVWGGCR